MLHTSEEYWSGLIKMGLTKLFLLRALLEGSGHGYDLARRARELSRGFCTPTEGAVYPVLREWEREGLVQADWEEVRGRRRRVYTLTRSGREAYTAARAVWAPAARAVAALAEPDGEPDRLADYLL